MVITALILLYIIIIIVMAVIIVNTSTPSKALAYLFLLFALPIIGVIVYLSIGVNFRTYKLYNKKLEVDKNAFPELAERLKAYTSSILLKHKTHLGQFFNLAKFIHNDNLLAEGNSVELLINGEAKFPEVLQSLKEAKHHIHIQYYIYENDTIGNQVADILKEKAKQGVEVRFIYDDYGSQNIRKSFIRSLRKSGVEAFAFYKIRWLLFANRINYRNHRKIIIVDGKVGYVGGANISDKYINPNKKMYWRDTHIKVEGLAVLNLQRVFLEDWNFCANQNIGVRERLFPLPTEDSNNNQLVQIISSGPDSNHPNIMYAMIQAILLSKEEILITTPYFVPDTSFTNAIKIARLSSVNVKILIPGISDSLIVNAVSNSYYQEMLEIGVEIYKYQKGFVHAKTMVCDSYVSTVGTANLDQRSFDLNFEINAFIYDAVFSKDLRQVFFEDIKHAKQLELNTWKDRPYYIKFFERVARLMSPLM